MAADKKTPPQYLSREQMEQVIAEGGSVLFHGEPGSTPRLINRVEHLPTPADLALRSDDPAATHAAIGEVDDEIARLTALKERLQEKKETEAQAQEAAKQEKKGKKARADDNPDADKT